VRHTGKFVAYYRVSTKRQGESGLGLAAQQTAVQNFLNGGDWELVKEFTETESGKDHKNRPELQKALHLCRITGATLVIAKLDRLSRDVEFLAGMQKSAVKFVCADQPNVNEMVIHILAAVAQDERKRISDRIKAALGEIKSGRRAMKSRPSTRANGWVKTKLGPPPEAKAALLARPGSANGIAAKKAKADAFALDMAPVIEDLHSQRITSQKAIAAELNRRGIKTRQGRAAGWRQPVVGKLLRRIVELQGRMSSASRPS
jgi:DNA invertase Pin-like site-specific DNA recombinase